MLHRRLFPILAVLMLAAALNSAAARAKALPARHSIDLNSATLEQLELLPGVGKVRAQAILDFRKKSGGFRSVNDLLVIHGFSKKEVEKLSPYAMVGPVHHAAPSTNPPAAKPHSNPPVSKHPSGNISSLQNNAW